MCNRHVAFISKEKQNQTKQNKEKRKNVTSEVALRSKRSFKIKENFQTTVNVIMQYFSQFGPVF